ncbi:MULTISPECIES: class I ribonucleotide reductase maintenance protein YfaE [Idiomarina]|jgi:ferredoxin|uniref:(Fe-S)-binding protein n=3 Tax=Idiomarina TaxID=135575 RepID=A0A432Y9H2_9GAMM|nr:MULTISPECIES: class I ribonucleotide reductase maintenance protein YfaE [Idiomarina]MAD54543.1 (Fe-S)-binding protein [Idiomarinaceae bacterium]MEC7642015.1 class I ribonucleotide reductase maintenance protein YfaE [Pseudomonadota bacterium]EAQ32403.1 Iron-sulfur cluster-binding protein [Idiomarina baltica OS145]KXS34777.1 MAG: Iron-sulfur cluster-binding protein [Idiomarina sp. T82-3]MEC8924957.1 class I ribonucleotide reductase maintenance protein YfaE [Pseudomonadota bacterium]|tara:strand:+ start:2558 stop:2821 length:264 start_codon:yes stop_codon:yes gene_type:complete
MTAKLFKVKVNGQHELTVDASEGTLLDALEKHQLEVHYHCKSGFCGACRSKLKSGSVRYLTDPLAYVRKGDFLPCCCVPESDLDIEH